MSHLQSHPRSVHFSVRQITFDAPVLCVVLDLTPMMKYRTLSHPGYNETKSGRDLRLRRSLLAVPVRLL